MARGLKRKQLFTYESWDIERLNISPRSQLYNLKASGTGTGFVESLTSYTTRLAAAHKLSPAVLLGRVLAPLMEKKYWLQGGARPGTRGSGLSNSFSTHAKAINGTGVIARNWLSVIETLTMRNDLRFSTMLPWADVLSLRNLFRQTRAWCPSCYEEWRANYQIVYEPLLWTLRDVEICV
ncbi:MAG TPA: hypothetical protein DC047_09970 [Blastocatellia bacterium]|nr:hypothetical protein [Blastocatellia bacterium]